MKPANAPAVSIISLSALLLFALTGKAQIPAAHPTWVAQAKDSEMLGASTNQTGHSFGDFPIFFGTSGSGLATNGLGSEPSVMVEGAASPLTINGNYAGGTGNATLIYGFLVTNLGAGTVSSVPVIFHSDLLATYSASGAVATGSADASVSWAALSSDGLSSMGGGSLLGNIEVGPSLSPAPPISYTTNQIDTVSTNTLFGLFLKADANASNGNLDSQASASASADAYVQIDPKFNQIDNYKIIYANGVLPPTATLLPPTITGPSSVCVGATDNNASGPPGMASYTWTITDAGCANCTSPSTITAGANAQMVTWTAGDSPSETLTLTVTDISGDTSQNSVAIAVNPQPVLVANLWGTVVGHAIMEPAANLLVGASGTGLSVTAVNPTGMQGSLVTLVNGVITYTPPAGFVGQDQITYTLSSSCGPVQGTVSVNIISASAPPQYQVGIPLVSTCVNLLYSGNPGQQYVVLWESGLNGPWMPLSGPLTADANGLIGYSDCRFPLPSSGFYRVQGYTPPGMAFVPPGTFTMGDALDNEPDAIPTLSVNVSGFHMDTNLVSYSQWQTIYNWAIGQGYGFVNAGAGKAATHPVQMVDWYDAVKWCNARSQQAGLMPVYYTDSGLTQIYTTGEIVPYPNWSANGFRLPTEAEWEKAARGGLTGMRFPWGNTIAESQANYDGQVGATSYDLGPTGYNALFDAIPQPFTSPVGYFPPNGYSFYDMAGNVQGFCWDWYGASYVGGSDPRGPATGTSRVVRGGNWNYNAVFSRCASRHMVAPDYIANYIGLRCVIGQ